MHDSTARGCGSADHFSRRRLLAAAGCGGIAWLTPLAEMLTRAAERSPNRAAPRSVIVLWLQGGPSQLETFDPHPGSRYAGQTQAIQTVVPGLQIGSGLPLTAEIMDNLSVIRSVTSKEGDHERATYNVKTGFRPDPTLIHPSLGAILCHQLSDAVEIPRHISIMPGAWPARGGYLGDQFDAFKVYDPQQRIPDITARVPEDRAQRRIDDLMNVVERQFARGRMRQLDQGKTLHGYAIRDALRMMSSDQLRAFDIQEEPESRRQLYGDTPFGRGCLAAVRLIEVGVRCVEVTLSGWDSHANNHDIQHGLLQTLDPALAALVRDLKERDLFDRTIVLVGGEFGRTPQINPAGGRDHWPHGFSIVLGGGGLRGGVVVGETAADPKLDEKNRLQDVADPRPVEDIHATVLTALGVHYERELITPIGRPMALSDGSPIRELLPG
ncbi:MAG: DUF1501 domain-containing protein [Pirellulaceae bacterium]|nr:DUF1501 domain-containing protein [Pirellulaceae bacterium]